MHLTSHSARGDAHILLNRSVPSAWAVSGIAAAFALIFALDHGTAVAAVQHLYYLPIIFASVRFGYAGSGAAAAIVIALYHLANPHIVTFQYEESDVVQIALFAAVGIISAKLANDNRRLRMLATTDDLTGLHNLRSFEGRLRAMVRASRQGTWLALLVLDVDRLKSLNDVHGHLTGADAVRTVGYIIGESLPPDAIACRYGGDEFVVAVPHCSPSDALCLAEELRRAVSASAPVLAGVSFPSGTLSVSVGIASRVVELGTRSDDAADDEAGEELFRGADAALYVAKANGRNCVSTSGPVLSDPRRRGRLRSEPFEGAA